MKNSVDIKTLLLLSALVAALWASEARAATGSFEKTVSVDDGIVLDVSTGSGSIKISTGAAGTVEIIGTIKVNSGLSGLFRKRSSADAEDLVQRFEAAPPVELADGRLLVGHIKDKDYRNNVSISYEIVIPGDTEVVSHSGSGSQTISDVGAPVEVKTGSGRITLTNIGGAVNARTGSGSIKADGVAGAFEAHTGSGGVRMTQTAPGDVVVTTGSGGSELHGVEGALRVKAGSGRIVIDGRQVGEWKINTGSGSVRIDLPDDAAFDLDVETGSGGIEVDHPVTVQGKVSKRHLRGTVRGGGDTLKVDTGSGGVHVQ